MSKICHTMSNTCKQYVKNILKTVCQKNVKHMPNMCQNDVKHVKTICHTEVAIQYISTNIYIAMQINICIFIYMYIYKAT